MTEIHLKACMIGLLAITVMSLAACVATGHNNAVTDCLIAVCGGVGSLGVWERLKK